MTRPVSVSRLGWIDRDAVDVDFHAVRGDYDSNPFVQDVRQQIDALSKRVAEFKRSLH